MGSLLSWTPVYSGGHLRIGRLELQFQLIHQLSWWVMLLEAPSVLANGLQGQPHALALQPPPLRSGSLIWRWVILNRYPMI